MAVFKMAYLCDGYGCSTRCELKDMHCKHTTDENHARIKGKHRFTRHGDTYFELDPDTYFELDPQEDKEEVR